MRPSRLAARAPDGSRRRLIDTLRRRRDESWLIRRCEARERRLGEGLAEAVVVNALKGKNPWEYPAVVSLNPRRSQGTLGRAEAQKPRPTGPACRRKATGISVGETVCGFF
jgi:hypothetical protein